MPNPENRHKEDTQPGRREFLVRSIPAVLLGGAAVNLPAGISAVPGNPEVQPGNDTIRETAPMTDKLVVLWTSGDRDVAIKMVFMYTYNAKAQGWWKDITFIIWGHSTKLLSVDIEVREHIQKMIEAGVEVVACKACADSYGVSDNIAALGIEVRYMGLPLTEYVKDPAVKVLTF